MIDLKVLKYEISDAARTLINPGCLLMVILVFLSSRAPECHSSLDLLLSAFMGPISLNSNQLALIRWVAHQTLIFYMVGNYLNNELEQRYIYTMTRIKSKAKWVLSRIIHMFFLVIFYYGALFLTIILLGYIDLESTSTFSQSMSEILILTGYIDKTPIMIMFNIYIILVCNTFLLTLIQMLVTILYKNSILALVIVEVILLSSIGIDMLGSELNKYLPANQAIFIKHRIDTFSFSYSYMYLGFMLIVMIYINIVIFKKYEL